MLDTMILSLAQLCGSSCNRGLEQTTRRQTKALTDVIHTILPLAERCLQLHEEGKKTPNKTLSVDWIFSRNNVQSAGFSERHRH
ncbi:hypothetical protein ZHAS_00004556 [Anopheles sinensis]|uniref:Uncharacterized protein n=1 Tax=Anopheles sinensis TaxID=74873 RepID=A0A084VHH9_ANOSI|nr:hypothetical protein ZHAS_00004556 [Anopheles sinensis]